MKSSYPIHLPTPYQDSPGMGTATLRDGTQAVVHTATPDDVYTVKNFYLALSEGARSSRFMTGQLPVDKELAAGLDSSDLSQQCSLIVTRTQRGGDEVIATGTYQFIAEGMAEFSVTVMDDWHNKGIGTLLLERMSDIARRNGISKFQAYTSSFNRSMLQVFKHSGFGMEENNEDGLVTVDLSMRPSLESVATQDSRNRQYTATSLTPLFSPKTVALVGASRKPGSIGYRILEGLVKNNFTGDIYPVNPNAESILDMVCVASVDALPVPVDLAVIAVPATFVLGTVEQCGKRGVKALLIISAGFAESGGDDGRQVQADIVRTAQMYGMRIIGPNCLGLINTDPAINMNASFSPVFPPQGRIAMASQSGALGLAILALARQVGLGLSSFVSMGNKADVSGNDLIQYWMEDKGTDVILLYLEAFKNPRRFARIARIASREKPIVCVKGGRTSAGQRAAGSHTAALAGSDVPVDALFHQTGVIRCDTLEEMFSTAQALVSQPLPQGRNIAVVTNAGGPGILCADACESVGLLLPELPEATQKELNDFLPAAASATNPVDMIASAPPEHFQQTVRTVMNCDEIDTVLVIYIPVGTADDDAVIRGIADGVDQARADGQTQKPVFACLMQEGSSSVMRTEAGEQIPVSLFPESVAEVLARLVRYAEWKAQPMGSVLEFGDAQSHTARHICKQALAERGEGWLSAIELNNLAAAFNLPFVASPLATTMDEAVVAAEKLGFPVTAKLASTRIVHKTEVGGVYLNLKTPDAVREAFANMQEKLKSLDELDAMDGMVIQPMLKGGVEVMIGVSEDPTFGPLMAFGLGGIHVEIIRDVCFRVTPLENKDAKEMVREIKGYRLLEGYRGHPPGDVEAIEELLLRVSMLVEEVPEIQQIDLNPVFALPPGEGCAIVDARIKVGFPPEDQPVRYTDMG